MSYRMPIEKLQGMFDEIRARAADYRVLVIGDAILDTHFVGATPRRSPETGCPVFLPQGPVLNQPGGAANVALGLAEQGVSTWLAFAGEEGASRTKQLLDLVNDSKLDEVYCYAKGVEVPWKQRFGSHLRVDIERPFTLPDEALQGLLTLVELGRFVAVVFVDYMKGMVQPHHAEVLMKRMRKQAGYIYVTTKRPYWAGFMQADVMAVNKAEWLSVESSIIRHFGGDLVVTFGEKGIAVNTGNMACGPKVEPVDVCGAGDSAFAAYIVADLLTTATEREKTAFADYAGRAAVQRRGTAVVTPGDMLAVAGLD